MKLTCHNCSSDIRPEDINVTADVMLCRSCSEAHSIAQAVRDQQPRSRHGLFNFHPADYPRGAWFEEYPDGFAVGASTHHPIWIFLLVILFGWCGIACYEIYIPQLLTYNFSFFPSLFGLPFVVSLIFLSPLTLMLVAGEVSVRVNRNEALIFTGIGPFGRRRRFFWSELERVYEQPGCLFSPTKKGWVIIVEGKERYAFGVLLTDSRRYFIVQNLRRKLPTAAASLEKAA